MIVGHIGGGSSAIDVGDIGHSLRFRASASTNLRRTPSVTSNRRTWTWSGWVKPGSLTDGSLFKTSISTHYDFFTFTSNRLRYIYNVGPAYTYSSTALFRDPTAWIHIVLAVDTTQALDIDRVRMFANGVLLARSAGGIPQNSETFANLATVPNDIGSNFIVDTFFDGYISRIAFVDGQALTPDAFAYLNTESNAWVTKSQAAVKSVVDAGGTNSFMLDFDDGTSLTTLGYDKSSKGNNWTLNNFSLTPGIHYDWMLDTPSNNFAVLNALNSGGGLSWGNLRHVSGSTSANSRSSFEISSGKWYWEFSPGSASTATLCGICNAALDSTGYPVTSSNAWIYAGSGQKSNGGLVAYGASFTNGDVVGVAFDADSGTLEFFKNGVSQGVAFSSIPVGAYFAVVGQTSNVSLASHINCGQRPFAYTPPTGFKALCTANLSDGETITTSGSFTGNANADGPYIDLKGVPTAMTINGNAVTFGTHADKTAFGFKVRSSSSSYNAAGSNTYSITSTGAKRKYSNAQGNP